MEFSPVRINKISRVYQNQVRIAELNKKVAVKRVQSQMDQVSLSPAARKLAAASEETVAAPVSIKA